MYRRGRKIHRTAAAAATAAVMLTAAGCGSAGGDGSRGNGDCTSPGVTENEIKLGLLYPETGAASNGFSAIRAGVDARLGAVNAAGGVHGRTLTYAWRDDESALDTNLSAARALVENEGVFGLIETSSTATASATFLHEQGVPVIGPGLEPAWTTNDNMFTFVSFFGRGSASTWGDYTTAHGGRTALIIKNAFSEAAKNNAEKVGASLRAAGVRVAGSIDIAPPVDPGRIGAQIKGSGADTLIGLTDPESFAQAVIGARQANAALKVAMSFSPGYDQLQLQKYGRQLAGTSYFLDYTPFELNTPGHREYLGAAGAYAPQLQPPANGGALSGWISADMMIRGLHEAGDCPTREQFIRGLRAVKDYDAGGLLPAPLDMTSTFGQITTCFIFVTVSGDGTRFDPEPTPRCGRRIDGQ